jgi:CrcB protein
VKLPSFPLIAASPALYFVQSTHHLTRPGPYNRRVRDLALVCLGGALGSGARYLVALGAARWPGPEFPWGTLAVNLAGAFLIGVVQQLAGARVLSEEHRLLLSTGVLGGFTTYSAFSYETVRLAQVGDWRGACLNVAVTTVACLALSVAGIATARSLAR